MVPVGRPRNRYIRPSTRMLHPMSFGMCVQCRVTSSYAWSASDQIEKYGSWVTSGTAGGRNGWPCKLAARNRAVSMNEWECTVQLNEGWHWLRRDRMALAPARQGGTGFSQWSSVGIVDRREVRL